MNTVISVEGLSKVYRLGQIGGRTLSSDLSRWWARFRGKPDPFLKIGQEEQGNRDGERIWALRDVSFSVMEGDILGIIGRNGAGKSTLLKVLARITAPTFGAIRIKGRVASLLEIGTGFHPELSGRENIYLNGAILGMTRQEVQRKLDAIVEFAETQRFLDTPVKRYSSGMYVRLAFAVAAHLDPEILLVDEVLAVGDAAFQNKCLGKIGEVAESGRTVLFVSHNMASIQALCPSSLVLEDGGVQFSGPTPVAVDHYLRRTADDDGGQKLARYRRKGRKTLVRSMRALDGEGRLRQRFEIGATIILEVSLDVTGELATPSIGIGIDNELGIRVFTVSTAVANASLVGLNDRGAVRATLTDVRLVPGKYFAKIAVGDGYSDLEILEQIPAFEILPSDYFGSGRLPRRGQGMVIQNVSWSVIGQSPILEPFQT